MFAMQDYVCEQLKEDEAPLIRTMTALLCYNIRIRALIGIGALLNKNTFEGGRLFERRRLMEGGR